MSTATEPHGEVRLTAAFTAPCGLRPRAFLELLQVHELGGALSVAAGSLRR